MFGLDPRFLHRALSLWAACGAANVHHKHVEATVGEGRFEGGAASPIMQNTSSHRYSLNKSQ
jgi:hypothetical protein